MRYGRLQVRISLSVLALCFTFAALSFATKKPPLKPININTANSEELQQVPGIGPATAEKILQMRKSYGSFKGVDDLLAIKGIGKKRLEKMRKYLTVSKSASVNKSVACPDCPKTGASQAKASPPKNVPPSIPSTESENPPQPQ
jgi:competence ComEA-like helix-hairpin-helix protein